MNKKNNYKKMLSIYSGLPKEIYILFLGKIINCIGSFIHPLLSLILIKKIGLTISQAGEFVTFLAVLQAPCILIGGKLVDTIGRKKIILIFQGLSACTFIICGFLPLSNILTNFILIACCFSSVSSPAYDALVSDLTNAKNRRASFSLIYIGLNLGFSIGPLLGGFLFNNYLNLIFIGDGITTIVYLLLITYFVKDIKPKILYNSIQENLNPLEKFENCSVFRIFLKRPILIYYSFLLLIFQFAYSQWSFAIPIQLNELFSSNGAKYFGFLGSCNGIVVVLFTPLIASLTKKYKILSIISMGGILYSISFGLCSFISKFLLFIIVIIIMTIGEIAISINSQTFIANLSPASHRGRINSFLPLIYGMGNGIGPILMSKIISATGIREAFLIVSLIVGIGGLLMYFLNYINTSIYN
ncbi:MFS transporter [Clostridium taeniosporum]|uniref:MFS transporter n=1 Tax=Clostridium taeniosporum TaxID=394958 RepID=A0A1D7XKV1_9CLOT|nr:MFS transporter [Clostridium taeniosporum]AOR23966.1 MFS transporter [Clostridium taeniosporum]